ncbi:MAG TPA: shikimate dehydrogenase [Fibrobacteres bacterium]|jgi:shikimate dehydrogenase|nr:shikimate dehydrogenase [Fibrobacterota bacterium]
MLIRGTTRLLGVLGNPVAHSYSPAMHNAAIERLGLDLIYVPMKVETRGLKSCLNAVRELDFLGVNVTVPHKQNVMPYLDEISEVSRMMGAVNTIVKRDGKLFGTTTDPEGFLAGFREAGHSFDGKSVAILGNGGAARTIAFALFHLTKPKRVAIVARDPAKSQLLAREIKAKLDKDLETLALDQYAKYADGFEVLVHTTPVGMHPKTDESLLPGEQLLSSQIVYDLIYNPEETALLRQARERGCHTVGGLAMLVHQGIASFKLWTGIDPNPAFFYEGIQTQKAAAP